MNEQLSQFKLGSLLMSLQWLAMVILLMINQGCGSGRTTHRYEPWPDSISPCRETSIAFLVVSIYSQPIPEAEVYALTRKGTSLIDRTNLLGWVCLSPDDLRASNTEAVMFCHTGSFCNTTWMAPLDEAPLARERVIVLAPGSVL